MKPAPEQIDHFLDMALQEDVGPGDYTSMACIPEDARSTAQLLVKDVGVIAGVAVARRAFQKVDSEATFTEHIADGTAVRPGDIVFEVSCNTRALLMVERVVLNTMQRMSGIATLSNQFLFEVEDLGVTVLDTRKTTPLIRFLEKWAVKLGGCENYRFGLYDWFMIKDNHIDACGGIAQAIERVAEWKAAHQLDLPVTVEVRNLQEVWEVMEHGKGKVRRVMFDNFELPLLREGVAIVGDTFETEASGGITLHNIRKVAQTGVQYISVGALTHSATSLDMSLKVVGD